MPGGMVADLRTGLLAKMERAHFLTKVAHCGDKHNDTGLRLLSPVDSQRQ
jgi:hypothetical protein